MLREAASAGLGEVGQRTEARPERVAEWIVLGELPIKGIDQVESDLAGLFQHLFIADEIGDAERKSTVLAGPEHVAGPAKLEIGLGNAKSVGRFFESGEAFQTLGLGVVGEEEAIALKFSAGDPAAQLMQL